MRCVWDCRADMLRQPYNSAPATIQQVNTSSAEYALLKVKYACLKLPETYVAAVFGFSIETSLMPSDIGYEQELYDAIDLLSFNVNKNLSAANLVGTIIFSIKNSVYHNSFSELLLEQQLAACAIANVANDACLKAIEKKENSNYIYRRRLLSDVALLRSSVLVEGIFIANDKNVISNTGQLVSLRESLIDSIQQYASEIGTVQNIENFDFSEITTFTTPGQPITTTPSPVPEPTNTEETQIGLLLLFIGLFGASTAVLAIYCVSKA